MIMITCTRPRRTEVEGGCDRQKFVLVIAFGAVPSVQSTEVFAIRR